MARRAKATAKLLAQVNARWPARDKTSDGWIGDQAHASRKSGHNPNAAGVVCAQDIDDDPASGADMTAVIAAIVASRDPRVEILIHDRLIWRSYKRRPSHPEPWTPEPYTGPNAHEKHAHIEVVNDPALYDNEAPWALPQDQEEDEMTPAQMAELKAFMQGAINKGFEARDAMWRETAANARADATADPNAVAASAADIADELAKRLAE